MKETLLMELNQVKVNYIKGSLDILVKKELGRMINIFKKKQFKRNK